MNRTFAGPRRGGLSAAAFLVALSALTSPAGAQLAASPWPMHQHDPQHTGRSHLNGPQTLPTVLWSVRHEGKRRSAPSVGVDGTIYLGAGKNPVLAIDPADGSVIWEPSESGGQTDRSQPAIDVNGNVYLGARDNDLWSIASTGVVNWRFSVPADGDVTTPPTIASDGTIFMASDALGNGKTYALNPNGTVKWNISLGKGVKNVSPALSQDESVIYLVAAGHQAVALDAATGAELWRNTLQSGSAGSRHNNYTPVVGADGTIYFGLRSGLFAVDPSGTVDWEFLLSKEVLMSPPALAADGTIYLVSSGKPARLRAIHPNGTLAWEATLPGNGRARNTPPVVGADGKIYVGVGKFLSCFNAAGGVVWQLPLVRDFGANPVIGGEGILYFGLSDDKLYAVAD